jgi:hypothetical protein
MDHVVRMKVEVEEGGASAALSLIAEGDTSPLE